MLNNLKIGDDFLKILEKVDPHKICELDDRMNALTSTQDNFSKILDATKADVDRLRSKT